MVDILDPLFQFAQGNWSAGDFIEHLPAVIKIMGIRALAKTAGGAISMLPSPAAKVVGGIISGGADAYLSVEALKGVKSYGNEIINRLQYGNTAYNQTKNIVDQMSDEELTQRFGVHGKQDSNIADIARGIGLDKLYNLTGRTIKFSEEDRKKITSMVLNNPEMEKRLYDPNYSRGFADTGKSDTIKQREELAGKFGYGTTSEKEQWRRDAYNLRLEEDRDNERKKLLDERDSQYKDLLLEKFKKAYPEENWTAGKDPEKGWYITGPDGKKYYMRTDLEFIRQRLRAEFWSEVDEKTRPIKNKIKDIETEATSFKQQVSESLKQGKEELKSIGQQFSSTSESVSSTASQYYEGAKTPSDKAAATVSLAGRGLAEMGDLFVNKARPSAEKIDLTKIINQGIDFVDKSFSQASEISTMLGKEGGFQEFIGKVLPSADTTGQLLPDLKRDTISPDPNDDPNNIWKGIRESWGMPSISNNVMNTGKSSSQSISQGSISSRMNTGSFRECSALNYHACVP